MKKKEREELLPVDLLDVLLDPDNTDPIVLMDENGKMMQFAQIAVIPHTTDGEKKLFTLLAPLDKIEGFENIDKDTAIVFRVDVDEGGNTTASMEEDAKIANEVYGKYLEMLHEHGIPTDEDEDDEDSEDSEDEDEDDEDGEGESTDN